MCTVEFADRFVMARIVQGIGGAMMTPVGRMVLVRTISKRELVGAMVSVTRRRWSGPCSARHRWLHRHLRYMALDLHHQCADRFARHPARNSLHTRRTW